jgi:outer membrane receptor protein involved in Fe transport
MSKKEKSGTTQFNGISYRTTIGAAVAAAVGAGPALAQDEESIGIEEITVTATKRGEVSIMDLAGSIQAFDTAAIRNQGLTDMESYTKLTPALTYFGNSTGQGKVFIRGIADAPDTFIVSQSSAVYLDEQPVTQGAAVDPRLVDIERVEVLSGPQGTLFGSSSQSGTLRIVTNKPDPTAFEAFADVTVKGMSEGDNSFDISGMINMPLADDKFALRLVGFSATEGGFIDNVEGTTGNCEIYGKCAAADPGNAGGIIVQSNSDVAKDDWNETSITGGRASAKWFINDNWSATLGLAVQSTEADAENTYDPTIGDLELIAFNADTFEDDWSQYALTIEGNITDNLSFTSATAYFTRDTKYTQDTTEYASYFGSFCYYFTATYNIYCFQPAGADYWYNDPIGYLTNDQENTNLTQEFRLAYTGDKVDWVVGAFYEDRHEEWDFDTVVTNQGGYANSAGFDNWTRPHSEFLRPTFEIGPDYFNNYACASYAAPVGYYYCVPDGWGVPAAATDSWWFSRDDTDWETLAVFGEATFHISDAWSFTAGARWFEVEQSKQYFVNNPGNRRTIALPNLAGDGVGKTGCLVSDGPCNPNRDIDPVNGTTNGADTDNPADTGVNFINSKDDDIAIKVALQYNINDDVMVYGLYSEGFRAGGVNRNRGAPRLPQAYTADFLENTEFGMKGSFAEGRMNVSATIFFQDWVDYQLEVVDPSNIGCSIDPTPPCGQPWQKGVLNAGSAHSDGFELAIEALPTDQFSLRINATWLESELDDAVPGIDAVGKGSKLPFAPEFKASLFAQYNWPMNVVGSNEGYFQFQFSHTGKSLNQVQAFPVIDVDDDGVESFNPTPQLTQEAYNWSSVRFGLVGDSWEANIFINNLTDERGQLYHDVSDFEPFFDRRRTSVIRPREYGIRFTKHWGG